MSFCCRVPQCRRNFMYAYKVQCPGSIYLSTHSNNYYVPHTSILKDCAFCAHCVEICIFYVSRSSRFQWPRGLSCGYAAPRLLWMLVWIPQGEWIFISCESCVLSVRGLCDGLVTCPEESYRLWCVWVWSLSPLGKVMTWNRLEAPQEKKTVYDKKQWLYPWQK